MTKATDDRDYCFHCGCCGSLFLSSLSAAEDRVCPTCGMRPIPSDVEEQVVASPVAQAVAWLGPSDQVSMKRGRQPGSRRHVLWKVMVVWLMLLGGILMVARSLWNMEEEVIVDPSQVVDDSTTAVDAEREEWLKLVVGDCAATLREFLATEVIRERYPLVIESEQVRQRMDAYYQDHPIKTIEPDDLVLKASTVLNLPEGKCVLTQWETVQGHQLDAAFRLDGIRWKLDWDHFVRYSEMDLALFSAGAGKDEAEFRLLARERVDRDGDSSVYGVVLHAPQQNRIADAGFDLPMMPMPSAGRDAKLLMAAFRKMRENRPMLGADFCDINPHDMIRVRVRVKRRQGEIGHRFEITKVAACHWYASSAWGVTIDELKAVSGDSKGVKGGE